MKCPKCGNETADNGRYCTFCSAELHPNPQPVNRPLVPLAQGSVARSRMEQWRETARKKSRIAQRVLELFFGIPAILVVLGVFSDEDSRMYEIAQWIGENWWVMAISVALLLWVSWMVSRDLRAIEEIAEEFLPRCESESLVIDAEKIYGSTARGSFTIYRDKVRKVECKSCYYATRDKGLDEFSYQVLTIYDATPRSFEFITFSNARELCTIIQSICAQNK